MHLTVQLKRGADIDPTLLQLDNAEASKKIMTINPLGVSCEELLGKDQGMSLISVSLENKTENYYYLDEALKAEEEKHSAHCKGISVVVEDIFCDLRSSLVKTAASEDLVQLLRSEGDKVFSVEIITGVSVQS